MSMTARRHAMDGIPLYPLRFEPIYQYRLWGGRRPANLLPAPLPRNRRGAAGCSVKNLNGSANWPNAPSSPLTTGCGLRCGGWRRGVQSARSGACYGCTGRQSADTVPESVKAAEHQQRPCDPIHQREPDSHNLHFEEVDKPREQDKPGQGTEADAGHEHQARNRMADDVFDSDDYKRSRESEERQGIGKHKQGGGEKGPGVAARRRYHLVRERPGAVDDVSHYEQDDSAHEADPVLFEGNEVGDERDPEGRDHAVDHITGSCAHPDNQAVPRPVFQRAPDAEDADRSNRRRERKPNDRTLHEIYEVHAVRSSDIVLRTTYRSGAPRIHVTPRLFVISCLIPGLGLKVIWIYRRA